MIFSKNLRCEVNEYARGTEYRDTRRYDSVLGKARQAIKYYQSELILQSRPNIKSDYHTYGSLDLSFNVFDNPSQYEIRIEAGRFNYHDKLLVNYNTSILTKLFIGELEFLSPMQDKKFHLDGSTYYLSRKTDMSLDEFKEISELLAQEISTQLQGDGGPID